MMQPCVVRNIKRPDPKLVAELGKFGVATIHEAYKQQGLMKPELSPVVPGLRICGPAVTSLNHPGDNLMLHAAVDVAQPGDVLVVTTKFPSTDGMFGELIATQCKAKGLAGVILDAGSRDTQDLRDMRFPIWSRARSAAGTSKATPGWVNVPVVCAGAIVNPGDVIVADDDGSVVVRPEDLEDVIKASQAREDKEAGNREHFAKGEVSMDVNGLRAVAEGLGVRYFDTADDLNAALAGR